MADLSEIQSAGTTKIIGSSSTGLEQTPVQSTSNGGLHTNLRDALGVEFGTQDNPFFINGQSEILSPLPGFVARSNKVLASGAVSTDRYTMTQDIAIVDFCFGGRGVGQASLVRMNVAQVEIVPSGRFNSTGDVSAWTNAGAGSSALLTWSYNTVQKYEGTGSAAMTFTASATNDSPAIKYTYSTAKNVSEWCYISARVRVTVAAGGSQTRTVSVILTDVNGATRTYSVAGTTITSPFSTEQWVNIFGEIENPTSFTGTFDPYNVSSVTLKLVDGGNKAGTIYWDDVHFECYQQLIERIYIDANVTTTRQLNPVELFDIGEVLAIQYKNNDASSKEFTVTAKGVLR